jgi:hypothetical protein
VMITAKGVLSGLNHVLGGPKGVVITATANVFALS